MKNRVYVIEFVFHIQYAFTNLGKRFFIVPTPNVIFVQRCFLSLRKKIPSAIVLRLVKFLEGGRHRSIRGEKDVWKTDKKCESYFFQPPTATHFFGGDEDTRLQFRFTCTNKNLSLKNCVVLFFPLIPGLLHHCPELLVIIYTNLNRPSSEKLVCLCLLQVAPHS